MGKISRRNIVILVVGLIATVAYFLILWVKVIPPESTQLVTSFGTGFFVVFVFWAYGLFRAKRQNAEDGKTKKEA